MILLKSPNWDKLSGKLWWDPFHRRASPFISFFFLLQIRIRLTATNIEENVVTSYLVHEANCIVSMPEFALRLQISIDDKTTANLFRIFDTVRFDGRNLPRFVVKKFWIFFCRIAEWMRHYWFSGIFTVCIILNQTKSSNHWSDTNRVENVWRLWQRTEKSNQKSFTQCTESYDGGQCGRHHWNIFPNRYHTKRTHYNRYVEGVYRRLCFHQWSNDIDLFIGELRSFLQTRPEYRHLFETPPQHKIAAKPKPKAQWIFRWIYYIFSYRESM